MILTQPAGYIKKPSRAMWLMRIFLRKYPALLRVLEKRHAMYNETVQYIEEQAAQEKSFSSVRRSRCPSGGSATIRSVSSKHTTSAGLWQKNIFRT